MKITLRIKPEHKNKVCADLSKGNVQFAEDASFIISEKSDEADIISDSILCRQNQDMISLPLQEIYYFESLGRDVFAYTENQQYKVSKRIYQLERELPEEHFIRISNSVIIRKNAIRKIRPALSQKFTLTLTNHAVVDVTRTYYYKFKECYGI